MSENASAEDRNDWAEDRTILANERTFAGWMRTGMACLAIAIGLQAVFGSIEPTWIAKLAATVFVLIALSIFWFAWANACKMISRLNAHTAEPVSQTHFGTIAGCLAAGSIFACVVLWLL